MRRDHAGLVDAVAILQLVEDVVGPHRRVLQIRPALTLETERLVDVKSDDLAA